MHISTNTQWKTVMLKLTKHAPLLAVTCTSLVALCGTAYTSYAQEAHDTSAPTKQGFTLKADKGQVIQLIAPDAREGAQAARQKYYDATSPLSGPLGFTRIGQLNVSRKIISDYDPGAFIFFSWPDEASYQELQNDPRWPALSATRPDGWDELKIYSLKLEEDLAINFDPAKHYTVVVAWLEDAGDYDRYLDGIEPAMARAGGRFVYKMRGATMEAHNSPPGAPGQITFVEWDNEEGFAKVQQSPEYQAHQQFFRTGVERFEFYWLKTRG